MGFSSHSVLEKEEGRKGAHGISQWEWPEPAHASSSQGLAFVHRAEASLCLVLWGVHLMEDLLWFVSWLFIAQKKLCVFPWLVAYTTFFT